VHIDILTVGPIETNCYLVTCAQTRQAAIIDPGGDARHILEAVRERQAQVKIVVNTHAHWDHIAANAEIVAATGAPLALHPDDLPLLRARGGAALWNVAIPPSPAPAIELKPDDVLEVGQLRFKVMHTPGHSPGHVCLYEEAHQALFDGDVLFRDGIGRSDLPGGDPRALMDSIKGLMSLPDEVEVYPGHGPPTTIGREREHNLYLSMI
jgi:hydroxyacylglutathione hydrolase